MRWLVVRALGLWIVSIMITSAVVLVVRSDPQSPTLEAIGLTLCQDAPCFRGLKVGSSWDEVQIRFPPSQSFNGFREVPVNIGGIGKALIGPSEDRKTVKHIALFSERQTQITAGEIVARYGTPCLLMLWQGTGGPTSALLIYPELKVYVDILIGNPYAGTAKYQLQLTSPVFDLWVSHEGALAFTCDYNRVK